MLDKIAAVGYRDDLPDYLRKRVKPTNILALLMVGAIAIPFAIITPVYLPKVLAIIPISGAFTGIGVLIANYYGGIRYSRFFLSLLPVTQIVLYNMYLCGPLDDPIPSVYLISLSFSLVPFVTFDVREKGALIFTCAYSLAIIVAFPITRHWATLAADTSVLRYGWLGVTMVVLGVVVAFGCMIGLSIISKQSEKETEQSKVETEAFNQQLLREKEENERHSNELKKAQIEEKKRQWVSDGLAQISEVIRRVGNDEGIFDELLKTTIKHLKANQGGLFTVDDFGEDTLIRLAACYAYDRKKFLDKTIEPGEGIVGQAYLEKEHAYFTEIPASYVNITSGLGQATPTALLVMPLKVNDVVEGILEVASFQEFAPHEIEFLAKSGEIIAAHIQSQRMMQSTQELLKQAQEQAEELRAAEEEMRQNQEELTATQEEMNRRYQELEARSAQREQELLAQLDTGETNSQSVSS